MANIIKEHMAHKDEARLLLKQVYNTDADIKVDKENKKLIVRIHKLTYWKDDAILGKLCDQLNLSQTIFSGTEYTLFYKSGSS